MLPKESPVYPQRKAHCDILCFQCIHRADGNFWFRTRHRRSEIALRMAMGSSRGRIRWQLLGEGLLLLALASIPALMICSNMVMADVTFTEATDATWGDLSYVFYCLDIDGIDGDCRNLVSGFTGHEGAACRSIAR